MEVERSIQEVGVEAFSCPIELQVFFTNPIHPMLNTSLLLQKPRPFP